MKSFLSQVATHYGNVDRSDFARYCFVFPNKRSGQFFERELQHSLPPGRATLLPQVTTISEFVATVARVNVANQLECLFVLYKAYCEVMADHGETNLSPFDDFIRWATIIVRDFDDIDTCMVDYQSLYGNINNLNDITTDPIDDELRTEINRYLNVAPTTGDDTLFVKNNYMTLWHALPEIYARYHALLDFYWKGKTSVGMAYRRAATRLRDAEALPADLSHRHYVMVGFVWLSNSERAIFTRLKEYGVADFWWDDASWAFGNNDNAAARLMSDNVRNFPPPAAIERLALDTHGDYHVVRVPSRVGQTKVVRQLLRDVGVSSDETRTAIVLPDESLLQPLLNAIGNDDGERPLYDKINVTIGYRMKSSSIVSLMNIVARCHTHARRHGDGTVTFYREDVRDILSHPVIKTAHTRTAINLTAAVDTLQSYEVPVAIFDGTPLQPLFDTTDIMATAGTMEQAVAYIDSIYKFVDDLRQRLAVARPVDINGDERLTVSLQGEFMRNYGEQLLMVRGLLTRFHDALSGSAVMYLVNRLAAACVIPFSGEPLQGIQVMGMLETRCLDFDNLIILSANERALPQRSRANSFIANWLRRIYGLPSVEDGETMSAYYFFRLLSRASKVRLVYDTSSMSHGSTEPSRFISQLEMLHLQEKLPVDSFKTAQRANEPRKITVPNPGHDVMTALFGGGGSKRLSASSINKYIQCPLRFYLHYIVGLPDDNVPSDFMDYSEFGTIVHDTLQAIYEPLIGKELYINDLRQLKQKVERMVRQTTNRVYFHNEAEPDRPLIGNALILSEAIERMVHRAIELDIQSIADGGPLVVVGCEHEIELPVFIGKRTINFYCKVDRIDRVNGILRIVDFKTGKDKTSCGEVRQMFEPDAKGETCHAMLQLMLYCNAYTQNDKDSHEPIRPYLYKLSEPKESGFKIAKQHDYLFDVNDVINIEFLRYLGDKIDFMMGEQPFGQCESAAKCVYCRYSAFCNR